MYEKIFCKGVLCRKSDRSKCHGCGVYVCDQCAMLFKGKKYCIDCGVKLEWKDLKKEVKKSWDDLDKKPDIVLTESVKNESHDFARY